jgi:hypothetical protein
MKKYTLAHFMRAYSLIACIVLIPVMIQRLPDVDFATQVSMILVWSTTVLTFVVTHLIVKEK